MSFHIDIIHELTRKSNFYRFGENQSFTKINEKDFFQQTSREFSNLSYFYD